MTVTRKPPTTVHHSKLAFDPGHTTGIAYHNGAEVVFTCTIHYTVMDSQFVRNLLTQWQPAEVVIEKYPAVYADKTTVAMYFRVVEVCKESGIRVTTVSPGTWKPVRAKHPQFWKEHLKDAVDLLFYNT